MGKIVVYPVSGESGMRWKKTLVGAVTYTAGTLPEKSNTVQTVALPIADMDAVLAADALMFSAHGHIVGDSCSIVMGHYGTSLMTMRGQSENYEPEIAINSIGVAVSEMQHPTQHSKGFSWGKNTLTLYADNDNITVSVTGVDPSRTKLRVEVYALKLL